MTPSPYGIGLALTFDNALDGQALRLVALNDTVRSAQCMATGDSVPVALGTLPTIEALFQLAITARESGQLVAARVDAVLGYPTRIALAGLPDASGVIVAADIECLP